MGYVGPHLGTAIAKTSAALVEEEVFEKYPWLTPPGAKVLRESNGAGSQNGGIQTVFIRSLPR